MEVSMETIVCVCVCVAVGWWKTGGHCVKCEQVLWALALYCNEALGNITSFMCCSFLYHTCGGGSSYSVCVWDRKRGGRERSRKKGERKTTRSPPLFFFFFSSSIQFKHLRIFSVYFSHSCISRSQPWLQSRQRETPTRDWSEATMLTKSIKILLVHITLICQLERFFSPTLTALTRLVIINQHASPVTDVSSGFFVYNRGK